MDKYTTWGEVPDHLATKTQLGKDGLKLAPGQPVAAVKVGRYGPYDLYDRRTAVPKRPTSQAQKAAARANLEKARAALCCVECGVYGERLDPDGRCRSCGHWHWVAMESEEAGRELAAWASRSDYLILDTETTGLGSTAEVVQVGIVDAAGRVLLSHYVRPSCEIEPEATAVHGLDAAALASAPSWPEVYPQVAALINGRQVLAYNAEFDARMLRQTCRAHGTAVPAVSSWVCLMELYAAYRGDWSDYHQGFRYVSLGEACARAGVGAGGAGGRHDAAGDALLAWGLLQSFKATAAAPSG